MYLSWRLTRLGTHAAAHDPITKRNIRAQEINENTKNIIKIRNPTKNIVTKKDTTPDNLAAEITATIKPKKDQKKKSIGMNDLSKREELKKENLWIKRILSSKKEGKSREWENTILKKQNKCKMTFKKKLFSKRKKRKFNKPRKNSVKHVDFY